MAEIPKFIVNRCPDWSREALENAAADASQMEELLRSDGKVIGETGAPVSLRSSRDPQGEAARQIETWLARQTAGTPKFAVALGFGCGWHIERLAKGLGPGSTLLVMDPCPAPFLAAARNFDFSRIKSAGVELLFAITSDCHALALELERTLNEKAVTLPAIMEHPASARAFPSAYARLNEELSKLGQRRFADVTTNAALSGEWLLNALENLPLAFERPGVESLNGLNKGGAAIVIAAGPSLDTSIECIRKLKEQAATICVGTALKSLLAKNIVPDFVVVVDSDPKVAMQFEGVDNTLPFHLLAPQQMPPKLLERFKERLLLFSTKMLPGMNSLLEACGVRPAELATGGTVALTAIEVARLLGAKTIFLAGLDLAVAQDGRSHSSGSVYDGKTVARTGLLSIAGTSGGKVLTTAQFAHYVGLFDSYFTEHANEDLKFLNLSATGAALKGTSFANASEALALAQDRTRYKRDEKPVFYARRDNAGTKAAIGTLERVSEGLRECSAAAAEALRLQGDSMSSGDFSGAVLAKMNSLDKKINSDTLASGLCGDALKALSLSILNSRPAEANEALSKGMAVYEALAKASSYISTRLTEAIKHLRRQS